LKFEPLDFGGRPAYIGFDPLRSGVVGFLSGQVDQFTGIAKAASQSVQSDHHLFQLCALLAKILGAIGIVPNAGLLELAGYFLKALVLIVVIKDTSSRNRCAPRDL
jgi:hypothetical protein